MTTLSPSLDLKVERVSPHDFRVGNLWSFHNWLVDQGWKPIPPRFEAIVDRFVWSHYSSDQGRIALLEDGRIIARKPDGYLIAELHRTLCELTEVTR